MLNIAKRNKKVMNLAKKSHKRLKAYERCTRVIREKGVRC